VQSLLYLYRRWEQKLITVIILEYFRFLAVRDSFAMLF
jgi:hypothetical protein